MHKLWSGNQLPIDCMHHILSYANVVVWRHGKYMNRFTISQLHDYERILVFATPVWFPHRVYLVYRSLPNHTLVLASTGTQLWWQCGLQRTEYHWSNNRFWYPWVHYRM